MLAGSSYKLSRQTSCDADLQLSHFHEQLFYKPRFAKASEHNELLQQEQLKQTEWKMFLCKNGKNEQREAEIIRCGY